MSWNVHITTAPTGELRLQFGSPVARLDMGRDTARHLGRLLMEAALSGIPNGDVQPKTSEPRTGLEAKNKPNALTVLHPNCCDCDDCLNP